MQRREFLLSAGGIVGATAIGSVAYTRATVTRNVTANVAADSVAVIGLEPGPPEAIYENGNDRLTIDTTVGDSSGLNSNGEFVYGDPSDVDTGYGFSVTNNDGSGHDLTVSLQNMSLPGSSWFKIDFYAADGASLATVSPNSSYTFTDWNPTNTLYAVVTISTSDTDSGNSIDGDLVFEAI
jgi:hypothetical protein